MSDALDAVRVAHERRAQAVVDAQQAADDFARALREAKQAGASDKALQEVTGLTRQRLWQIARAS